ncbi:putative ribonuclease H-like domain-containing protein, partial [Tanacetum coccineum]
TPLKKEAFDNPSLVELNPSKDDQLSEIEEHIEEQVTEIMAETMEQYMSKTREDYGGSEQEDANKHIEKKWHNGTSSRTRSTETSDGLIAIQAQLNNLRREIKKVNEKVYAAQVGCELCKGPHYTKDCPQKEEGKTLEEAYYTQFGAPYQPGGQYRAAGPGFYQRNNRKFLVPA